MKGDAECDEDENDELNFENDNLAKHTKLERTTKHG